MSVVTEPAAAEGPSAPVIASRLLSTPPTGPDPRVSADQLIGLLRGAGLVGHGGAGFPTWQKLRAASSGRAPVVVGNAMEGEHLSHKDRHLLATNPALVLAGLRITAAALGAKRTILAVGDRSEVRFDRGELKRSGIELIRVRDSFLAGQESALVNAINDRPAVPSDRWQPVWRHGVDRRPTLVSNVETFAHVALIVGYGVEAYRSLGTPDEPGTMLVTVSASSRRLLARPTVLETPIGTPLAALFGPVGVNPAQARAVLVGGYHGAWVTHFDAPLSRAGLAPHGATPGAGILHLLDRGHCPLQVTADVVGYLAGQTAGQCGPCINGLPRMADTLTRLAARERDPRLVSEVARLARLVDGRGACAHPDGTARLVISTMRTFAHHVEEHLNGDCHAV